MIRQVKVENFREQIALNKKLSAKNSIEGGIFQPRSSSSDSLRVVYQAEKTQSFFPSSPQSIQNQSSPKGVTQLRNYINNTIKIIDKNEYRAGSSSFTGSPNNSPSNYSPQSPSSFIICSSNSKTNPQIQNNFTQQIQQFSNHGIRTLQCPPQGSGSQRQILVQVVQPQQQLLNQPTIQQQQQQQKNSQNTISQTYQLKQTQPKQLNDNQQIVNIAQQKQHQGQQEQQLKVKQKEISSNFLKIASLDENTMLQQNDKTIINSAKINDLNNEIQRLLKVNENLTQETHSWRQKYELSEIRRQILEQEQTQMREVLSDQKLDSSRQISELAATQAQNFNNNQLQTKQIQESLRVRSPSCSSLEDSQSNNLIQEKQRNFQQIVQQLSSLENLKKTADQSNVENLIASLQEENTLLKQRLLKWEQLDKEMQERERSDLQSQQLEIQRLETTCKKLKQQLDISHQSENSKDQIIRDLEKDKEMLLGRLNLCMQDLQKGSQQEQKEAGRIISYFDETDIFYHSKQSQETKGGLNRGKKTPTTITAGSGNTLQFGKINQVEKSTKPSNLSCTSKNSQEYRYNSSRNTNNSPSSQSSSNAPSIEHSQANDILEKTSNLTRVIHSLVQHPSSSVKTIEYTSHASSQQSSQQQKQQPQEEKYRFEQINQENNEYHQQFSFHPEQHQRIGQNESRQDEKKEQINQNNSQRRFNHSQQNHNKKIGKDTKLILQEYSQRSQQRQDLNQIELTLDEKYPSFFEEKENQSISKSEMLGGNYSFSQKENCRLSKQFTEGQISPRFIVQNQESFDGSKFP